MDENALYLLGKKAKLDGTKDTRLPLLINEEWGSDLLSTKYKERLSNVGRVPKNDKSKK